MVSRLHAQFLTALLTCLLAFTLSFEAAARIGETRQQLIDRFGLPLAEEKDPQGICDTLLVFDKHNVKITAGLLKDVCVKIVYKKLELFTDAEGLELLRANSKFDDMGDWSMDKTKKYHVNDAFFIRYEERYDPNRKPVKGKETVEWDAKALFKWNTLTIFTQSYEEAERDHNVKKKSGIAEKLKDF